MFGDTRIRKTNIRDLSRIAEDAIVIPLYPRGYWYITGLDRITGRLREINAIQAEELLNAASGDVIEEQA